MRRNRILDRFIPYTLVSVLGLLLQTGCITYSHHAIPADRLPPELKFCQKGCRVPVNLSLLAQTPQRSYLVGPGDVLSIYVRGLLPAGADDSAPLIQGTMNLQRDYYPPDGNVSGPAAGVPIQVAEDGTIPLPVIGSVNVSGLTVQQIADKIVADVVEKNIVIKGKEYIYVTLVRPRVHRIVVVREETEVDNPTVVGRQASIVTKRGSAQVVDLPAFENDVLHALTASGGMPGIDAMNEVWILRREHVNDAAAEAVLSSAESSGAGDVTKASFNSQAGAMAESVDARMAQNEAARLMSEADMCHLIPGQATARRIPLWTQNGQPPCFSQCDVILRDGDIVYLRARQRDVFYTGGLINGAEIPLPRDHDIDILEAVALANSSVGGPGGSGGQVFRAGAGPGNIIPPTRAVVLRRVQGDQQVAIRVDLERAVRDVKQRIVIQPGDFVMLYYKPGETFINSALNFVNFNFLMSGN